MKRRPQKVYHIVQAVYACRCETTKRRKGDWLSGGQWCRAYGNAYKVDRLKTPGMTKVVSGDTVVCKKCGAEQVIP